MSQSSNSSAEALHSASPAEWPYPRPQHRREHWTCLNGPWRFTFDHDERYVIPEDVKNWDLVIQVPFAPEAPLSGIGDTGFHRCCWYERDVELKPNGGRTILHFGAVDYSCKVWVNGQYVGSHEGGHTPFHFDVTDSLSSDGQQRVTVRVIDDPHDLAKPRGKQDWQLEPHSIWYPRTTGIWQTVWAEQVPMIYLQRVRWTPHLDRWEIGCEAVIGGRLKEGLELKVRLSTPEQLLIEDTYRVIHGEVTRRLAFSDPGIDDFRNHLLWSPEKPTLIDARLQLWDGDDLLDEVQSYTALRSVAVQHERFMLNGRPYYLRLVLDQGYWPESLMTAPTPDAFRRDIELTKQMGFNGVRKHQKIEDPHFLHLADKLGLLVWEEMPSAYRFTHDSVERIAREWTDVIDRDYSHPCIITWVPFNESWGVPDLAEKATHQSCVQALYHLTRTLDPTRPVIGNDGWESTTTDIIGIHDYDNNPQRLAERYNAGMTATDVLGRRRPAGRLLALEGHPHRGQPFMLTEFGGIAFEKKADDKTRKSWGYAVSQSAEELENKYRALLTAVNRLELFSGFCYTQLTDTYQEVNGLLYADRTPKFRLEMIASATRGHGFEREETIAGTFNTAPPQDPLPEAPVAGSA